MYLCFPKQDLVVADFQLIYDTDNIIQLDFYAEGLRKQPLLCEQPIFSTKIGYGFLKGSFNDYEKDEKVFWEKMKDKEWVDNASKSMIRSIIKLHKITRLIETSLDKKEFSLSLWEEYFSTIAESISHKRFSYSCEPMYYSSEDESFKNEIKDVRIPSHVLLFYKKLDQLKKDTNDTELHQFIKRYGFLYDFQIASNPFENESELREILKNHKEGFSGKNSVRHNSKNFSVILYKRVAWYEEMRHYYQARALRNYRLIFEQFNMDIFKTGIDDFYKKIQEEVI